MDIKMLLTYIICLIGIFVIGKIFIIPIKWIVKLIINSIIGVILLYIINLIGGIWNFHIGINIITSVFVGILGVPGAILLMIFKLI